MKACKVFAPTVGRDACAAARYNHIGQQMRRIVVTGLGAVSPLGCGVELIWSGLLSGRSGLRSLPAAISADLTARVAGMVPDKADDTEGGFDPDAIVARKEQRKMDRFIMFAMVAAAEAIAQARWAPADAQSR